MNSIEDQLRRWKPQPPSSRVRDRIFAVPAEEPELAGLVNAISRWLVPVMGCFLVVTLSLSSREGATAPSRLRLTNSFLGLISAGNQSVASFAAADLHSEQNNVPHTELNWTRGLPAYVPTSAPSLETNILKH